jgi:hypothetical protein
VCELLRFEVGCRSERSQPNHASRSCGRSRDSSVSPRLVLGRRDCEIVSGDTACLKVGALGAVSFIFISPPERVTMAEARRRLASAHRAPRASQRAADIQEAWCLGARVFIACEHVRLSVDHEEGRFDPFFDDHDHQAPDLRCGDDPRLCARLRALSRSRRSSRAPSSRSRSREHCAPLSRAACHRPQSVGSLGIILFSGQCLISRSETVLLYGERSNGSNQPRPVSSMIFASPAALGAQCRARRPQGRAAVRGDDDCARHLELADPLADHLACVKAVSRPLITIA